MNPYEPPSSNVANAANRPDELAGRGERLGAALLDSLIMLVLMLPIMFAGGYWQTVMAAASAGERPGVGYMLAWAMAGFAMFVLVQGVPLSRSAQTWGKKVCKVRIADMEGGKPPLGRLLLLRYLPVQVIGVIPVVGMLFSLTDCLFVFSDSRRCLHDRIAGTQVLRAD